MTEKELNLRRIVRDLAREPGLPNWDKPAAASTSAEEFSRGWPTNLSQDRGERNRKSSFKPSICGQD